MSDFIVSIGDLIEALAPVPRETPVLIDGQAPTALQSYRGYYDHLAIGTNPGDAKEELRVDERPKPFEMAYIGYYEPGVHGVWLKRSATVCDLVDGLTQAIGTVFEGYKGGQYEMRHHTDLWVSEWGDCDSRRILRAFEVDADSCRLQTLEVPW